MIRGITWHSPSPISKNEKKKKKALTLKCWLLPCILACHFSVKAQPHIPSWAQEAVQESPWWQEQALVAAATVIIHLTVYYLHVSSAAVEHHNSSVCVISHCTAAVSCSGPWQNTTWWLFQTQAKTAEAEGSATKPGYLLFIIQFPDWWFHKPAAKCCVLYCQQTNGLNGRRENNVQDWGNQLYWGN